MLYWMSEIEEKTVEKVVIVSGGIGYYRIEEIGVSGEDWAECGGDFGTGKIKRKMRKKGLVVEVSSRER